MTTRVAWTLDESGLVGLAQVLALKLRVGDVVALKGDLGTGKTTFARALIAAILMDPATEVPSPTFSLYQSFSSARFPIAHYDFYRLSGAQEAAELGFEEACRDGVVIVEWPERAATLLPETRIEIDLAETDEATRRCVELRGIGEAAGRVDRVAAIIAFLERQPAWRGAAIGYLQGDASTRAYARLSRSDGRTAVLMDAARQPDGPPIRDGKPYSQIAHLAEDMAQAFMALAAPLRAAGLSAPEILAHDLAHGLLLVEDLGDRVFSTEVTRGTLAQGELWQAAVDALILLRQSPPPELMHLPGEGQRPLPLYDLPAMLIEVELLVDWYWPALHGGPAPAGLRTHFLNLWTPLLQGLHHQAAAWVLRDFHSPNLVWLPERSGVRRVGILDFQDAQRGPAAYDLVSLLQDARVEVPEVLEAALLDRYCKEAAKADPSFNQAEFAFAYNVLGAQRNTKILGIFVRLAHRDGKRQYLTHLPRIWGYLERNLRHVTLAPLAAWYENHFPAAVRTGELPR